MPKIAIIDTVYPDFIKSIPFTPDSTYDVALQKVLARGFGTSDFYGRKLKDLGWEKCDVIANHRELQLMWGHEHSVSGGVLFSQIEAFKPDVVFLQDLSLLSPGLLAELKEKYLLAGQCSCQMPKADNVKCFDILFTSFPHYVDIFTSMGVKAVYNPLAFEPSVLPRIYRREPVDDCVFVGGVGTPSHWSYGMKVLNAVAENIPTFKWWGYGSDLLPKSALREKYIGPAFGLDMYEKLANSRIVINRHGEVSGRFANNMRMFEATGMGAMLLTDMKDNLGDFFTKDECVAYESPEDAVDKIRYYLEHEDEREVIAAAGQKRTLRDHTYSQRMKTVSDELMELL